MKGATIFSALFLAIALGSCGSDDDSGDGASGGSGGNAGGSKGGSGGSTGEAGGSEGGSSDNGGGSGGAAEASGGSGGGDASGGSGGADPCERPPAICGCDESETEDAVCIEFHGPIFTEEACAPAICPDGDLLQADCPAPTAGYCVGGIQSASELYYDAAVAESVETSCVDSGGVWCAP